MVKIVLRKIGEIPKKTELEIVDIIEECYERLKPHEVTLLDLLLFRNASQMRMFYSNERSIVGVVSENLTDQFFALHDAWRGTSRISVCLDRMKKIPRLVQTGALRHEVGHSVLHGSLEYYVFPITSILSEASKRYKLSNEITLNLLYLISIAVKDFQVTKLLLEGGYFDDQVAYSKHVLTTSEEDLAAWNIAQGNPSGMVLSLAGRLKDVACFTALLSSLGEAETLKVMRGELSYLPNSIIEKILKIVMRFPEVIEDDTFKGVDLIIGLFVDNLFEQFFSKFD